MKSGADFTRPKALGYQIIDCAMGVLAIGKIAYDAATGRIGPITGCHKVTLET
jgi:hypothetical protein